MVFDVIGAAALGSKGIVLATKGAAAAKTGGVTIGAGKGLLLSGGASGATDLTTGGEAVDALLQTAASSALASGGSPIQIVGASVLPTNFLAQGVLFPLKSAGLWLQHAGHKLGPAIQGPGSLLAAAKETPGPLLVSASAVGMLKWAGFFKDIEDDEAMEASEEEARRSGVQVRKRTMMRYLPNALLAVAFSDTFLASALLQSWNLPGASIALKKWTMGALVMSFPTSYIMGKIAKRYGVRAAFCAEIGVMVVSYVWLCYGTVLLSDANLGAGDVTPLLWWLCFGHCAFAWSVSSTAVSLMILLTVASVSMQFVGKD